MEHGQHHEHAGHSAHIPASGYTLQIEQTRLPVGTPTIVNFSVQNGQGRQVRDFAVTHEKAMHFIVVNKDLSTFQHLHPELDAATGMFTVRDILLPKPGNYRVFADFVDASTHPGHAMGALAQADISAGDQAVASSEPIGDPRPFCELPGGYLVRLACPSSLLAGQDAGLQFRIEQGGQSVTDLENYLGARGHAVILSEGSLHFIHAHPVDSHPDAENVVFHASFPEAGNYKVFAQFQHSGEVLTAPFVLRVR